MSELPFNPDEFASLAEDLFEAGTVEQTAEQVVAHLRGFLEVDRASPSSGPGSCWRHLRRRMQTSSSSTTCSTGSVRDRATKRHGSSGP